MAMYTFNLQTVLDHRQFVEDTLKKELADVRRQASAEKRQLEALKRKEMNTAATLKNEQAEGLSSDRVVAFHAYLQRLSARITDQQRIVAEIKVQETEKQDELIAAMKKRQILEKLKEQGLEKYNQRMQKKEMHFIDEVAVNQFVRKSTQNNGDAQ